MSRKPSQRDRFNRPRAKLTDSFKGKTILAQAGDTDPLCGYLRSDKFMQLPDREQRKQLHELANLIESSLTTVETKRGRPEGTQTPHNFAVECAAYLVKLAGRWWCEKHHVRYVRKTAPRDLWIATAIELIKANCGYEVTADQVREHTAAPRKSVIDYVYECSHYRDEMLKLI